MRNLKRKIYGFTMSVLLLLSNTALSTLQAHADEPTTGSAPSASTPADTTGNTDGINAYGESDDTGESLDLQSADDSLSDADMNLTGDNSSEKDDKEFKEDDGEDVSKGSEEQETVEEAENVGESEEGISEDQQDNEEEMMLMSVEEDETNTHHSYVSGLMVSVSSDGTAAFTPASEGDDNGKDSSANNSVVRSFDSVEYLLYATFASMTDDYQASEATVSFEMSIDASLTEAGFDFSKMAWINSDYQIDYLDASGNVVSYSNSSCKEGEFYWTNGLKTSINQITCDSTYGENSYTQNVGTTIVTQRLTGTMKLKGTTANPYVVPGTQSLSAGLKVLNAKNGRAIQPRFRVWIDDNEENLGYSNTVSEKKPEDATAQTCNEVTAPEVTVSSGNLYNTEIGRNGYLGYRGWFDFSTGKEVTSSSTYTVNGQTITNIYVILEKLGSLDENIGKANPSDYTDDTGTVSDLLNGMSLSDYQTIFDNIRYGRLNGYGLGVQISNTDTTGAYDMKGLSLPQGNIGLDVDVSTAVKTSNTSVDTSQYYAVLWDYNESINGENSGNLGRNIYWNNDTNTRFARQIVPYNSGTTDVNQTNYNGGSWNLTGSEGSSTGTGNTLYHFTISGYDFDLNDYTFPTNRSYDSTSYAPYTYEYNISSGYIEVLSVFPRLSAASVNDYLTVSVGNLNITSANGVTLDKNSSADTSSPVKYDYEVNAGALGNIATLSVSFEVYGSASKHSSFTNRNSTSIANGFLGLSDSSDSFWKMPYDATAYAGNKIAIFSDVYMSATSDSKVRAYNILQLFDSHAFSIDEDYESTECGTWTLNGKKFYKNRIQVIQRTGTYESATFLYAADPDYKDGYDTNADGVLAYMNTVREEDLVYYTSLEALEADGYTCIGVLAEVRGCDGIGAGYDNGYCGLRIPVKVSDDESLVGYTVATVNAGRVWTTIGAMDGVSWANGVWNSTTGKNTLDGYVTITKTNGLETNNGNGNNGYVKAEFKDGQLVTGTNRGSYTYGNTLLILGYKAGITIDSDKSSGAKTYNLAQESGMVTYTLGHIRTELDDNASSSSVSHTNLVINLSLASKDSSEIINEDPDVKLLNGRYIMTVDGTEYVISGSSDNPTVVPVTIDGTVHEMKLCVEAASDGKTANIYINGAPVGYTLPDITVDAQLGRKIPNGSSVTATVTIDGGGDLRSYSDINGNLATDTVRIINLSSSAMSKSVNKAVMELDDSITYALTYTNKSTTAAVSKIYLYDVLPFNGDTRGTSYTENGEDSISLNKITAQITKNDGSTTDFNASIDVYYSSVEPTTIQEEVKGFSGASGNSSVNAIDEMLKGDNFKLLGTIDNSSTEINVNSDIASKITCIYAVATNLGADESLDVLLTVDTNGNKATDIYGNVSYGFIPSEGGTLQSSIVQTTVVSRSISGVIWDDYNKNGQRDDTEKLMSNVTCTLFKLDEESGKYVKCREDIRGKAIEPVTTGKDGAYAFTNLSAGDYVVAFSGDGLTEYYKTTTFRADGVSEDADSNGLLTDELFNGISNETYRFVVAYSLIDDTASGVTLHTLSDYEDDSSLLKQYQENYEHQDLGLVKATLNVDVINTGGSGWPIALKWLGAYAVLIAIGIALINKQGAK